MITKLFVVFIVAFVANLLWEKAHSYLYVHYKSGPITQGVLVHAALFDACITLVGALLIFFLPLLGRYPFVTIVALFIFAVGLELFALKANRWAYRSTMPVIPLLRVGVTPAVQLTLLAYLAYFVAGIL